MVSKAGFFILLLLFPAAAFMAGKCAAAQNGAGQATDGDDDNMANKQQAYEDAKEELGQACRDAKYSMEEECAKMKYEKAKERVSQAVGELGAAIEKCPERYHGEL